MAQTPMTVIRRPFSVLPLTNTMMPDGVFDAVLGEQRITRYYTNTSPVAVRDVRIYLEGVGGPGIVPTAGTYVFEEILPGASVLVSWLADFRNASPGRWLVSFIAEAQGMTLTRTIKQIFVTRTSYDEVTDTWRCQADVGTLEVSHLAVIGPSRENWDPRHGCDPSWGPWLPTRMTMAFHPNPAYSSVHGDLPFGDPWWKILAIIVAVIAFIAAAVAAILGAGTAFVGVKGTFDVAPPSVNCCSPDIKSTAKNGGLTVAGVASTIGVIAVAVAMADDADPWWRGQEATPPANGELTVAEQVTTAISYVDAPNAGTEYELNVEWTYRRVTTGAAYEHAVAESRRNTHLSAGVEVVAPTEHDAYKEPLVIGARFRGGDDGEVYSGDDLFAFALLRAPQGFCVVVTLADDGRLHDEKPNNGWYTGSVMIESLVPEILRAGQEVDGYWRIYVFAQEVNAATPDMLPHIAAQQVGGYFIGSAVEITFDPSLSCPLRASATTLVHA